MLESLERDVALADLHQSPRRPLVPTGKGKPLRLPRHPESPDANDSQAVQDWLARTPRPWAVDLFSGAGGLSLGLEQAGFTIVAAADADPVAAETHAANIQGLSWCGDLTDPAGFVEKLDRWGIDHVELLAGGPPCQPFSRAGAAKITHLVRSAHRSAEDPRTVLWKSFFAVIDRLTPDAVLFENVPDFARAQEGELLVTLMEELVRRGYRTDARVLDAWRFNVPQHRKRLFVVAVKNREFVVWPTPSDSGPTLWDAIGDLPAVGPGQLEETVSYQSIPSSDLAKRLRDGLEPAEQYVVNDHITRAVRADDAIIYSQMLPGQTYKDVSPHLRRYRVDIFDDKYCRLRKDGLSRTITAHLAKDGYWYIHPTANRTLSIREAARVQTFPDRFRFAGYPSIRFRQIGNAVPPLLAAAIGGSIQENLRETGDIPGVQSPIRESLLNWHGAQSRDFPWRRTDNPWLVLLAEVCLHRTKAEQVAKVFPAVSDLGATPQKFLENLPALEPILGHLGLRWRFDAKVTMAHELCLRHGGEVPDDWELLRQLTGVGDYIAAAAVCFAFHRRAVLLDTNTMRIVGRVIGQPRMGLWEMRLELTKLAYPTGPDREWNYALLDLGSAICTPRNPKCHVCPIRSLCETGRQPSGD